MPYAAAAGLAAEVRRRLRVAGRARQQLRVVGSLRRREAEVRDLDLLLVRQPGPMVLSFARARFGDRISGWRGISDGPRRQTLVLAIGKKEVRLDIFVATEAELPYALFHYTGSRGYNIRTRALAKKKKWLLNQYGLFGADGRRVRGSAAVCTERDLALLLGVSYRRPAART